MACDVWEVVYVIGGLLKDASRLRLMAVASDARGQSTTVFGLSYMLGIELMPRIRNRKGLTIFYKPGDGARALSKVG